MADPNRSLKRLSNYYVTLCAHVLAAGLDFHSLTHVIIQMCSIESVPARRSFLMTAPYTWGALLEIISLISPTIMKLNYLVLQFKYAQHDQQLCRRFRYARKQPRYTPKPGSLSSLAMSTAPFWNSAMCVSSITYLMCSAWEG